MGACGSRANIVWILNRGLCSRPELHCVAASEGNSKPRPQPSDSRLALLGPGFIQIAQEVLAEWEYAARAGTTTPWSTGPTITTDQANFNGETYYAGRAINGQYRQKTVEVGSFKPNAFGLHDMHGNVWERVEDCYEDTYAGAPDDGSAVTYSGCTRRVTRGGSWFANPGFLRSARRDSAWVNRHYVTVGFRLARTLKP